MKIHTAYILTAVLTLGCSSTPRDFPTGKSGEPLDPEEFRNLMDRLPGEDIDEWIRIHITLAEHVGDLLEFLTHEDEEIQGLAIDALCQIRVQETGPHLAKELGGPRTDKAEAISRVLCAMRDGSVVRRVAKLLDHPDYEVRRAVVDALAGLGAAHLTPRFVQLLSQDEDYEVRRSAAFALRTVASRDATPDVIALLTSPKARRLSILALGGMEDPRAVLPLIRLLKSSDDINIIMDAAEALADLGAKEAVPALKEVLDKRSDTVLRMYVVAALAKLGDKSAIPALVPLLRSSDTAVQYRAFTAVALLDPEQAVPILRQSYEQGSHRMKWTALALLGQLGDRRMESAAVSSLESEDEILRGVSYSALADLGAAERIPMLTKGLEDNNARVARDAAQALSRLHEKEPIPHLIRALRTEKPEVLRAIADALGVLDAVEAIPHLERLCEHQYDSVQVAAAGSLTRLGKSGAASVLLNPGLDYPLFRPLYLPLNAIRQPAAWRTLKTTKLKHRLIGQPRELLEEICRLAKVRLVVERAWHSEKYYVNPLTVPITRRVIADRRGRTTLLDALEEALFGTQFEVILENDSIRVLRPEQARSFWIGWWAAQQG